MRPLVVLAPLILVPVASPGAEPPPEAPREFRGVWVATVGNIDWPSRRGLASDEQKREAIAILDRVASLRLNAVVFQVRTAADALYDSKIEPWSVVLTGRQGAAPEPYYDPLAFWVEEAHRRGLQLHAWINPFRARPAGAPKDLAATHVARAHPDRVRSYGDLDWMDPGAAGAREQTLAVVADIVGRYDVDGVHIDDYFYPYPVARPGGGGNLEFPDDATWGAYRASGGTLSRGDWRRENINRLVEGMYRTAHAIKPHVQVGISPFGLPRPGRVAGMKGFDQYEGLFADAELWLRRGWCDYWTPQLYWKIDAPGQPFRPLLDAWLSINERKRHVWPGLSSSRVGGARGYLPAEIYGQIEIIRESRGADGNVLFSMRSLMRNNAGFSGGLKSGPYKSTALVPISPWLDREPPARPSVALRGPALEIAPGPGEAPFLWAVWTRRGADWTFAAVPAATGKVDVGDAEAVAVSAVDRLGNESERATVTTARPAR